ncbi:hypothetical protein FRB94_013496 [Tulasnella sp. JGI-2019a]|nr:hypothetical protein FRB94_013496 [Tulasnella sp. JGI-2019a]
MGGVMVKLPTSAGENMQTILIALNGCDFAHLQSLTLRFCSKHEPPPWTMDTSPLMNLLSQNPSLRYVSLELPTRAATVTEGLGRLPQLNTLVTRRWKDSENTNTVTVGAPGSLDGLFPSLCNISSDYVPTAWRILSYAPTHLITSLDFTSSSVEVHELLDRIQPCSSLKSLNIGPRTEYPPPGGGLRQITLSFKPILGCTAMENFRIFTQRVVPANDDDLAVISAAWKSLTTFSWFSTPRPMPQATMTELKSLSANCRKLQRLFIPMQVGPELVIYRPYRPFCDGIMLDVR